MRERFRLPLVMILSALMAGCSLSSLGIPSKSDPEPQVAQVAEPPPPEPAESLPPDSDETPASSEDDTPVERPAKLDPAPVVPARWRPVHQKVTSIAEEFSGRISVVAIDLTTGDRYGYREHDRYLPASTFKLPVTLCVLEAIRKKELSWDTLITYTPDDYDSVGAGGFADAPFGGKYPVRNLVNRSLISSNNVAVKMLARTLTWEGLRACTRAMGGEVTRTEEGSTPVSASDEAAWWLTLWKIYQESPQQAENLLQPLRQVTYRGRIVAGTPSSAVVTHKFGTYDTYEHDGAIIWAKRPYLLVVMTHGATEWEANTAIEQVAAAAWQAMMEQSE